MKYKIEIAPGCEWIRPLAEQIMSEEAVPRSAKPVYDGRNSISRIDVDGHVVSVKSYKVPHLFNRVAYSLLRPSKARRAFENGLRLEAEGISTARPYAFIEQYRNGFLRRSWLLCEHIEADGDLRYVEKRPDFPEMADKIARLMHKLHDRGIWMKDLSGGNVLLRGDEMILIDINRMEFGIRSKSKLSTDFSRIVDTEEAVRVIARAYSGDAEECAVKAFRDYHNSIRLKRTLKKIFHR